MVELGRSRAGVSSARALAGAQLPRHARRARPHVLHRRRPRGPPAGAASSATPNTTRCRDGSPPPTPSAGAKRWTSSGPSSRSCAAGEAGPPPPFARPRRDWHRSSSPSRSTSRVRAARSTPARCCSPIPWGGRARCCSRSPPPRKGRGAGSLRVFSIPVGEDALRRRIEIFRGLIARGHDRSEIEPALAEQGRRLFEDLLGPARAAILSSRRLLIVPDGPLHALPFGALVVDGLRAPLRYLAELEPLHVAASMTVYAELKKARARAARRAGPRPRRLRGSGAAPAPATVSRRMRRRRTRPSRREPGASCHSPRAVSRSRR